MNIKKDVSWYCWLVATAVFMSMLIASIASYGTVSVLVYVWIEKFNITTETAVWAPAVMNGSMLLAGPIISLVIEAIGIWQTHMLSGVLACTGAVITAFATQFWHVIVGYALLQGLAVGVLQMTCPGIVPKYFDKHKDKVYGANLTGFFIGILIAPTLTEYLIDATSYKLALIIEGSMFTLLFPAALILRGPCCSPPAVAEENSGNDMAKMEDESKEESSAEEKASPGTGASTDNIVDAAQGNESGDNSRSFVEVMKSHKRILTDPKFILYLVFLILLTTGENTYYALAVDYAVKVRNIVSLNEAALGMTLTGVSTVIGSLFTIVLCHWSFDKTLYVIGASLVIGLDLVLLSIVHSLPGLYATGIVFGLSDGAIITCMIPLIAFVFGQDDNFLTRVSYALFATGIGSVIGPIAAGQVGKSVGEEYSFYFLGASTLLSFLLLFTYWLVMKIRSRNL